MTECNSEAIVDQVESIRILKNLRQKLEEGKTSLPISLDAIDAEIQNQRQVIQDAIAVCGSLEGIPDNVLQEIESEAEPAIDPLESTPDDIGELQEEVSDG